MEYIHDLVHPQITKLALSPVLIVPALMSIALAALTVTAFQTSLG